METATHEYPKGTLLGKTKTTHRLYELEVKRNFVIREAARELGVVLGHKKSEFWTHTMPEELLNILDSFERTAAALAADAYLQKHGK